MHVIIPAGGSGTRLWPLSRRDHPKFLSDLTGAGRTLLQQTVDRMPAPESLTIVTGAAHAQAVQEQVPDARVIVEPSQRGTMGAIGLAAALVERTDPEAIIGSFAADHIITEPEAFQAAVERACEAARSGLVVTLGIEATAPSTAYGYIEMGQSSGPAFAVTRFVEKPDAATAAQYLATGRYVWNAGMFIARASVLLDALAEFHPDVARALRELASRWDTDREDAIAELWDPMPATVIDTAVAEPLAERGGVAVVPASMGWSDVGDFASLADVVESPLDQVTPGSEGGPVLAVESEGSLIYSSGTPIVVAGLPGAVVVDMNDVLLVTTRERAQVVKDVVRGLSTPEWEGLA